MKEDRSREKSGRDSEYGKKILLGRGNSPKTKEYGLTGKKKKKKHRFCRKSTLLEKLSEVYMNCNH